MRGAVPAPYFFFDISDGTVHIWSSRSPFIIGSWGENTDVYFWTTGVSHGGTSRWSYGFAISYLLDTLVIFQ